MEMTMQLAQRVLAWSEAATRMADAEKRLAPGDKGALWAYNRACDEEAAARARV